MCGCEHLSLRQIALFKKKKKYWLISYNATISNSDKKNGCFVSSSYEIDFISLFSEHFLLVLHSKLVLSTRK